MTKQRQIPEPLVIMLRERFPKLLDAFLEGENDVYLLMADKRGRPHHAVHYIASPAFMTAVRVCDSGLDNLATLVEGGGFEMTLLAPEQQETA
jgi:hypothetical protein